MQLPDGGGGAGGRGGARQWRVVARSRMSACNTICSACQAWDDGPGCPSYPPPQVPAHQPCCTSDCSPRTCWPPGSGSGRFIKTACLHASLLIHAPLSAVLPPGPHPGAHTHRLCPLQLYTSPAHWHLPTGRATGKHQLTLVYGCPSVIPVERRPA